MGAHIFGNLGSPSTKLKIDFKNLTFKEKPPFDFFLKKTLASGGCLEDPHVKVNIDFRTNMHMRVICFVVGFLSLKLLIF